MRGGNEHFFQYHNGHTSYMGFCMGICQKKICIYPLSAIVFLLFETKYGQPQMHSFHFSHICSTFSHGAHARTRTRTHTHTHTHTYTREDYTRLFNFVTKKEIRVKNSNKGKVCGYVLYIFFLFTFLAIAYTV